MSEKENVMVVPFGNAINFKHLYRIKGKQGIYFSDLPATKSRLFPCVKFSDGEVKCMAKGDDMVCLGKYVFTTECGHEDINMQQVFNNISEWQKNGGESNLTKVKVEDLMPIMVPNFDDDKFKDYHAKLVIMWYAEVSVMFDKILKEQAAKENKKKENEEIIKNSNAKTKKKTKKNAGKNKKKD